MCHHQDLDAAIDQCTRKVFALGRRQADLTNLLQQNEIDLAWALYDHDIVAFVRALAAGLSLCADQHELTAECNALEDELFGLMVAATMVDLMDLGPLGAMFGDSQTSIVHYAGPGSAGYTPAPFPGGNDVVIVDIVASAGFAVPIFADQLA